MSVSRDPSFEPSAGRRPDRRRADRRGARSRRRRGARPLAAPAHGSPTSSTRSRSPASSRSSSRPRKRREESLDHVLLAGPAGARQDLARAHHRRRARGADRADGGAGARAQGRHRRLPDRARARLGVLHRRDPPPQPGDRGDALSGDGGPPAADRPRPGRRRAHGDPRPAGVHARRRDHPRRPADDAAARPLRRLASASSTTSRADLARIVRRSAGILEVEIEPEGERVIAERSRGTPRVANRLLKRVRDYAEVRGEGVITADVAAEALDLLEVDAGRARPPRPHDPRDDRGQVLRRAGRALDPGRRGRRGAGDDRGRLRALPAPAGPDQAHPARPGGDRAGLRAPRAAGARARRVAVLSTRLRRAPSLGFSACRSSSARTAGTASSPASAQGLSPRPKACSKCGAPFLFELLDDYYPAPDAAFFICDQEARLLDVGRNGFELTGLKDEQVIGRPVREVLGLEWIDEGDGGETADTDGDGSHRPDRDDARVGRALARQARRGQRRGRPARPRRSPTSFPPTTTTAGCCSCSRRSSAPRWASAATA